MKTIFNFKKNNFTIFFLTFLVFLKLEIASAKTPNPDKSPSKNVTSPDQNNKWSILATLLSSKILIKQLDSSGAATSSDSNLNGQSYGLTAAVDLSTNQLLSWRGSAGYESFKASSSDSQLSCPARSNTTCHVDINYLNLGLSSRFNINQNTAQFWLGLGLNIKYPLSKNATALSENDIHTTMTYGILAGLDLKVSANSFIPFSIEQQYFLKSDTVKAELAMFKIGFGQNF